MEDDKKWLNSKRKTLCAHYNYTKAQSLYLKGYPDEKILVPSRKKMNDAFDCLCFFERDEHRRFKMERKIIRELYNTPERNVVDLWVAKKGRKYDMSYGLRENLKKEDVCEFLK